MSAARQAALIIPLHLATAVPDLYSILMYLKISRHALQQERMEA